MRLPAAAPVQPPPLIGHRGVAAQAPENTLAGFRKAAALGFRWVEFDVRLTADRQLVLMHDATLDRTTNGRGLVRRRTVTELAGFDAGAWFGKSFAGEPVPTLEQAIKVLTELGLGANVEIKADAGDEHEAGIATARVLRRAWPYDREPPLVSSFRVPALLAVRGAAPELPVGYLMPGLHVSLRPICTRLGCRTLHCAARWLTPHNVARLTATGLPLIVYTVNDAQRARELRRLGVTSVITDAPAGLHPDIT